MLQESWYAEFLIVEMLSVHFAWHVIHFAIGIPIGYW